LRIIETHPPISSDIDHRPWQNKPRLVSSLVFSPSSYLRSNAMPKATKTVCLPTAKDPSPGNGKSNSKSKSSNTGIIKKKAAPKSVLDKIVHAIRQQPPSASTSGGGGVSRVAITKYLKSEFDYDNGNATKLALKRGVSTGVFVQQGQSFRVKSDPVRQLEALADEETLQIEDVSKGAKTNNETVQAERGDTVTVKYVGTLDDGTQFDAAKSFSFMLGAGDVTKGWDQGLLGMTIGAKRKLVVPSRLGYGKRGNSPDIPPNATLHFEITMKKIGKGGE
jgi:FKBP-type peptidyl-prolyl cis-trans isomerase